MTLLRASPRVLSIPAGLPFLPTLCDEIRAGRFHDHPLNGDPLALSQTLIYVPTRRSARELRSLFVERADSRSAILPTIRPLGEFEEDRVFFESGEQALLELAPPIGDLERLMRLAPMVRQWIRHLPIHLSALYGDEDVVVPTSSADAIWMARDLVEMMDEIEQESADWSRLAELVPEQLANWWQVTLAFLTIVTQYWPQMLAELNRSDPIAHRNALITAESERLLRDPPKGPVIVAGSTGSIPAAATLIAAIAKLPLGSVVLPALDKQLGEDAWLAIGDKAGDHPSAFGHPQHQLRKLIARLGILRDDVVEIGKPDQARATRLKILSEVLRPADTTHEWAAKRAAIHESDIKDAFAAVSLIDAANERDEALSIAVALRHAVETPGKTAALITTDRLLGRRVAAELHRFGIMADDSGGTPMHHTPPGTLLLQAVRAVFAPGDPVAILALLKHPLLSLGLDRLVVRRAAELVELIALRGGTGRPDICTLNELFRDRFDELGAQDYQPFWMARVKREAFEAAQAMVEQLQKALEPLGALKSEAKITTEQAGLATIAAFEALGRSQDGSLAKLYEGEAGSAIADFLRELIATQANYEIDAAEWPMVLDALIKPIAVKSASISETRVAIWGELEARIQSVDTVVIGGLNEGVWPRRAQPDRFLSRGMKAGLDLDPPERRIGQAAHDFMMALGNPTVILSRSGRAGESPSIASRWLQRLTTFLGKERSAEMRQRGQKYLDWAIALDEQEQEPYVQRPNPTPPVDVRPKAFSVTEIETLRRDPYAIYARRILKLRPIDPLLRDPGAMERGNLFHDILHRFTMAGIDPDAESALERLLEIGAEEYRKQRLPADIHAIWWPRFTILAPNFIAWESERKYSKRPNPRAELSAAPTFIGATGATLRGRADRIDLLPAKMADILDYKTGSSPSIAQAHRLLSPQLALEAALLSYGAFDDLGVIQPSDLAYVRLKPNGEVMTESILEVKRPVASLRSAGDLAQDAWNRLEKLIAYYAIEENGYRSRALPFRESSTDGDYDHLARVLEWSAGTDILPGGGE